MGADSKTGATHKHPSGGIRALVRAPGQAAVGLLHTYLGDIPSHFVVTDNGKQIKQVVDANAVTAVGNRARRYSLFDAIMGRSDDGSDEVAGGNDPEVAASRSTR